jgi:hypothetical protein
MQFNFSSSPDTDNGLLLEAGLLAGRRYRLGTSICENPGCQYEHVTLHCFPETKEPPQRHPSAPICLEMDLARRAIANLKELKADSAAFTLAKAIESEITEAEWTKLRNLYFAVKQDATEHADPDQIDADFPPEVLAGDGSMVGYYEVLPYAKPVEFTLGADTLLLDDQYCVIPTCSCREAALSFLPLRSSTGTDCSPVGPRLSLRYDYDTGRIESLSTADALGFSGHDFINALKSAQPDLNSLLDQRHGLLRRLFRRALNRKTLRLSAPKPDRNDPCPCGSGKKFKKCCGV